MSTTRPTTNRSGPGTDFRPRAILAFLCIAQFTVFVNVSSVNLALPSIQDGLGMSDVGLNYVVTAYATVLGGFLLLGGRLADAFFRGSGGPVQAGPRPPVRLVGKETNGMGLGARAVSTVPAGAALQMRKGGWT